MPSIHPWCRLAHGSHGVAGAEHLPYVETFWPGLCAISKSLWSRLFPWLEKRLHKRTQTKRSFEVYHNARDAFLACWSDVALCARLNSVKQRKTLKWWCSHELLKAVFLQKFERCDAFWGYEHKTSESKKSSRWQEKPWRLSGNLAKQTANSKSQRIKLTVGGCWWHAGLTVSDTLFGNDHWTAAESRTCQQVEK